MVCTRCVTAVKQELDKLKLVVSSITLGEVALTKEPNEKQLSQLKSHLANLGFEVVDGSRRRLIEKIKQLLLNKYIITQWMKSTIFLKYLQKN